MLLAGCSDPASANPSSSGLYISEVVSSNSDSLKDGTYGSPDWVELYNGTNAVINLEDYVLAESNGNRYTFPAVDIAAHSYLVIYCCLPIQTSEELEQSAAAEASASASQSVSPTATEAPIPDVLCTGFKLSKDGTTLTLSSPSGKLQDLEVSALDTDISYGFCENGSYGYFIQPTPGAENTTVSFATMEELRSGENVALKISEVLPKNVSNTEPYAWVELYNAGTVPIALSDFYITENLSNLKKAKLPTMTLNAGEYVIVKFADNGDSDSVPFKIGSDETTVAITDALGIVVDKITWDAGILPGLSAGPGEDGSTVYYTVPTPGAANSAVSLSTTEFALTEGRGDVYMNELLRANTFSIIDKYGERSPWVELYNGSDQAVTLSDYALSDDAESLWKWNLPGITLDPGAYTVVYLSGKDQKEGELHANFKLGSADTALYLTNLNTQTVQTITLPTEEKDNVSYGLSEAGQWQYYYQPTPMAANTTQGFAELSSITGEAEGVSINEVSSVSAARSGDADWVELYNGSSNSVSLAGYCLSDSKSDTQKWPIGDINIKAEGYAVIDEYDGSDGSGELTISLSGEKLYLFSAEGLLLDEFNTGVLRPGISRGIVSEGGERSVAFFGQPTPGTANGSDTLSGYCAAPQFSVTGGYHKESFALELTAGTEGAAIYYTTNGATPTTSSSRYSGPITVSGSQTVRAIAIADGLITSEETVATYIFGDTHSLPVVCLSMTQSDLNTVFSSTRSNKREREGYVEYYEADGTLGVSFPAGFRVAGAGTIAAKQRSINLYLRGGYGRSSITYPFFEGYDITTFKSLCLRNMGAWQDPTRMKDVFVSMAVNGLNVDNAQSKFVVVYINGSYWGLYEFKENQNEDYFAARYGIDTDNVVMIRGNKYDIETGRSDRDIVDLYYLAQQNMNNDINYQEYIGLADPDYFMDYLIAELYFGCYDTYNQKFTHTTDDAMRWRPIFYDFDICMNSKSIDLFDTFFCGIYTRREADSTGMKHETYMYLYNGFVHNDEWKQKFIERFAEVLNTTLSTENLLSHFDALVDSIEDEIPRTAAKWPDPSSASQWQKDIKSLREIIAERREYIVEDFQNYFNLSDEYMKQLFPNG